MWKSLKFYSRNWNLWFTCSSNDLKKCIFNSFKNDEPTKFIIILLHKLNGWGEKGVQKSCIILHYSTLFQRKSIKQSEQKVC